MAIAVGAIAQTTNAVNTKSTLKRVEGLYAFGAPYQFAIGNAVYFTKEGKDYEILREGAFTYSCAMKNKSDLQYSAYDAFKMKINGNYKNGLKTGEWNSTVIGTLKEYENTTVTKVNYKEGLPHGTWTTKHTNKSNQTIEEVRCRFKNGVMLGKFYFADFQYEKKYEGDLDSNGFLNGRFSVTAGKIEYLFECQHGIIQMKIKRDASTGEILEKKIITDSTSRSLLEPYTHFVFDKKKSIFENVGFFSTAYSDKLRVGSINLSEFGVRGNTTFDLNEDIVKVFDNGLAFRAIGGDKLFKTKTPGYVAQLFYDWKSFVVYSLK